MALELASGADFWCNRHCKTNPVDLEGSRGQVLVVLGGFWKVSGRGEGGKINLPLWPKAGYEWVTNRQACGGRTRKVRHTPDD